ncbi:MAG: hypothetical protein Q4E56_05370, partial [Pseudomonadota bacterium]|nr:hypothetical protein [Pseudomonadota bacterium]
MTKFVRIVGIVLCCAFMVGNVSARSATPVASTTTSTSGRTGAAGRTTVSRGTSASGGTASVVARAGTTQKVIGSGTKVTSATKNVVVSEACQQKYDGCMDSFCMIENDNGGRCACSDDKEKFDAELSKIEKENQKSYQIATLGVMAVENGISGSTLVKNASDKTSRVDLSQWNSAKTADDDKQRDATDIVSQAQNARGKELHYISHNYCVKQIPECGSELSMLQLMYSQ